MSLSEDERKKFEKELKEAETEGNAKIAEAFGAMVDEMEKVLGKTLTDEDGNAAGRRPGPQVRRRAGRAASSSTASTSAARSARPTSRRLHKTHVAARSRRRSTPATACSTA